MNKTVNCLSASSIKINGHFECFGQPVYVRLLRQVYQLIRERSLRSPIVKLELALVLVTDVVLQLPDLLGEAAERASNRIVLN
jgi:hypothetical protein